LVLRTTPLLEQLRIANNINVQIPSREGVQLYGRQQMAARSSLYRLQLQAMLDSQSYERVTSATFYEHTAFYLNNVLVRPKSFLAIWNNESQEPQTQLVSYADLIYLQFEKVVVVDSTSWLFGRVHVPNLNDSSLDMWTLAPTSTSSLLPLHSRSYQVVFLASCVVINSQVFLNTRIHQLVSLGNIIDHNTSQILLKSG